MGWNERDRAGQVEQEMVGAEGSESGMVNGTNIYIREGSQKNFMEKIKLRSQMKEIRTVSKQICLKKNKKREQSIQRP